MSPPGVESAAVEPNQFCLARYFCQTSAPGLCEHTLLMQSLGFNWPAVAPPAQDAAGDNANYDITSREAGNGLCHLILHVPRAEMSILKARKILTACVIC